jgi:hypothetical protein
MAENSFLLLCFMFGRSGTQALASGGYKTDIALFLPVLYYTEFRGISQEAFSG